MAELTVSGLRGIISENLNNSDIINVIQKFVQSLEIKTCAIGRDTRNTSNMIHQAVISVLLAENCEIQDLGITSTPSVFRHVKMNNLDGGVIITSSHNPKEWNALKLLNGKGEFLSSTDGEEILSIAENDNFTFTGVNNLGAYIFDDSYNDKTKFQIIFFIIH